MTWWETNHWHEYEAACGDEPESRAELLAGADWQTRVVDLSQDCDALWAGVRKSYHSLINGVGRDYPPFPDMQGPRARNALSGPGHSAAIVGAKNRHRLCAGHQTRPDRSWAIMGNWIDNGNGLISCAIDMSLPDSTCAGYAYFIIHDGWSYYASAATQERDLGLGLIWWGILALKEHGVRWLELGWQGEADDDKGRNIEFVRRGFGGRDVPAAWSGRPLLKEEWESC